MKRFHRKLLRISWRLKQKQEILLLLLSCVLYLWLIFEKLTDFPIYFFCDEAVHGVEAYSVLTSGASSPGTSCPLFFKGLGDYCLSLSIYAQIPSICLFGLNEFAVRFTTACLSLVGVIAVYLLIRVVFRLPSAWLTFAIFALSPIWLLHSRTGFEYIMAVSFFLAFGVCYLLAFTSHRLYVFPAALCGSITFYTYTPGRGWLVISLLLLFLINFREHIRSWKRLLAGILLLLLLLSPYIYLHLTSPDIALKRFSSLTPYSQNGGTVWQQTAHIAANYVRVLHPAFWYTWERMPQNNAHERHLIPALPQLFFLSFPFACLGFGLLVFSVRKFTHRTILALWLASPFPASLLELNHARAMPAGIFMLIFSLIGLGWCLQQLSRWPRVKFLLSLLLMSGLFMYAFWFRQYVFTVAPYTYRNYGFHGVQMGAPQVFQWINDHHASYTHIQVSPDLFNAAQIFIPFYLHEDIAPKISITDPAEICRTTHVIENTASIVPNDFFSRIEATGCPITIKEIATLYAMNGNPLFHILQLEQKPEFAAWFQAEEQKRRQLQHHALFVQDHALEIEYPRLDIGDLQAIFDGNPTTFARSDRINPAQFIIHLPSLALKQIAVTICNTGIAKILVSTRSDQHRTYWGTQQYTRTPEDRGTITFSPPEGVSEVSEVTAINIIIQVTDMDINGYVHINDITWK